jgi:hypothetical protein
MCSARQKYAWKRRILLLKISKITKDNTMKMSSIHGVENRPENALNLVGLSLLFSFFR